jgi:hypothetical protein
MMELMNIVLFFSEASKSTWHSKVYDHFNITLCHEVDDRQKPKKLVMEPRISRRVYGLVISI